MILFLPMSGHDKIKEHIVYDAGPYKGYYGHAEYDHEAELFHGEVLGINDVVTFQGKAVEELRTAFRESVDDYLAFCAERNEQPQKPFSGKFVVRLSPESHRKLAVLAKVRGKSLNAIVSECLDKATRNTDAEDHDRPRAKKAGTRKATKRRG
jgi:predicted HicB family RNase H-like nuclease